MPDVPATPVVSILVRWLGSSGVRAQRERDRERESSGNKKKNNNRPSFQKLAQELWIVGGVRVPKLSCVM